MAKSVKVTGKRHCCTQVGWAVRPQELKVYLFTGTRTGGDAGHKVELVKVMGRHHCCTQVGWAVRPQESKVYLCDRFTRQGAG